MAAMVGVLALSGFATALASAATAGWMVNGTMLGATTKALATTAAVDHVGELEAAGIVLVCKGKTLNGVNPTINGVTNMGDASLLEFTECEVTTGNPPCKLSASMSKTVKTLPVLVDLTLDGVLNIKGRFLSTNSSKLFATLGFEGSECPLSGAAQPITGAATFLVHEGQDERVFHLLLATNEEEGSLKLGKNTAILKGAILVGLASGETWSFL